MNPEDGRRWGRRCPRLVQRGHGCWYFTVDLPAGRDGDRRRLRRGGFATRAMAEQARAYWLGSDVDPGRHVLAGKEPWMPGAGAVPSGNLTELIISFSEESFGPSPSSRLNLAFPS